MNYYQFTTTHSPVGSSENSSTQYSPYTEENMSFNEFKYKINNYSEEYFNELAVLNKCPLGFPILSHFAARGMKRECEKLIEMGKDPNEIDSLGKTALYWADYFSLENGGLDKEWLLEKHCYRSYNILQMTQQQHYNVSNYQNNNVNQYLQNSNCSAYQVDHYNKLQSNQMNHCPQGNFNLLNFINNNLNNSPSPYYNNYNNTGPVVMPAANKIHSNNNNSNHNQNHQNTPNKHQSPTKPKQNDNQSSNNKSSPQKNTKVPEMNCFCTNWKKCSLTKDEDHRSEFKHMCTIKNCTLWKDNVIHKNRFIHVCEQGTDCKYQDNEEHTHNFIHPCKYNHKCRYFSDPLHRIRFSHDLQSALGSGDTSIGWPDSWTYSPPEPIATLTKNNNNYVRLVDLSVSSDEYKKISNKFLKSVNHSYAQAQVKKIERIENAELWNDYACLRLEIKHKNGGNANEQHLYHGGDSATLQQIIDTGFDYRLCSKSIYGQGCNFAVNASHSHGNTVVNLSTNERVMLLCKVAIGESMVVQQPNSSLKRPYDSSAQRDERILIEYN